MALSYLRPDSTWQDEAIDSILKALSSSNHSTPLFLAVEDSQSPVMVLGLAEAIESNGYRLAIFRLGYDGCKLRQLAHVMPEHLAKGGYEVDYGPKPPGALIAEFLSIGLQLGYLCDESKITSPGELAVLKSLGRPGYGGRFKDKLMRPFSAISVHSSVSEEKKAAALRPVLFDDAFGRTLFRLRQPGRVISQEYNLKELRGHVSPSYDVRDSDVGELTRLVLDRTGIDFELKSLLNWVGRDDQRRQKAMEPRIVNKDDFARLIETATGAFEINQPSQTEQESRGSAGLKVLKLTGNHRLTTRGPEVYESLMKDSLVFPVFMTGVFNPFGPTLNVSVLILQDEGMLAHAIVTLNPFVCYTDTTHGITPGQLRLTPGDIKVTVANGMPQITREGRAASGLADAMGLGLLHLYPEGKDTVPFTFFHASRYVEVSIATAHLTVALSRLQEGSKELDNLRKTSTRTSPFDRFNPEDFDRPEKKGRRLNLKEAEELAQLLNNPQQQAIELKALLLAWEGAIQMSPSGASCCVCRSQELHKIFLALADDFPGVLDGIT
jgi:hypothetical protein